MIFTGYLWKEGRFWVIEVPSLEITTQGKSRRDAYRMIEDAIESHIGKRRFKLRVTPLENQTFAISSHNDGELIALFLKRQRQLNHVTVRDLVKRLGYASPSAYAQYESGKHMPGLDKISRFLRAMNPKSRCALEVVTV